MVKLVAIVVAPFAAALALYDLVVKRTSVTRFLFGMRPRRSTPAVPIARPGQGAA